MTIEAIGEAPEGLQACELIPPGALPKLCQAAREAPWTPEGRAGLSLYVERIPALEPSYRRREARFRQGVERLRALLQLTR